MNDMTSAPGRVCWVISDGKAGMEVQCRGLAEALGFEPVVKRIIVRRPWRWIPPPLISNPLARTDPAADSLNPPWPDVLIASGRQTVALSMAMRQQSGGRTFTIQVQNPTVDPANFDMVVAPRHDRLTAPNVVATTGGLNLVTEARLAAAVAQLGARYAHLPHPRVAVLIGGSSKVHRLTQVATRRLAEQLADLARREGAGLMVTPSRRTGESNIAILRQTLSGLSAEIWDGTGKNPYYAFLALADSIIVTSDSVNMVSEAATTGKPVFTVDMDGGSRKFRRFHETMCAEGITRPFTGRQTHWTYPPLRDTQHAAAEIRRRMASRHEDQTVTASTGLD
ncbi:MAG: mitochondrial fission ELM1 family protein [Alphaproteobacteria bacterium]